MIRNSIHVHEVILLRKSRQQEHFLTSRFEFGSLLSLEHNMGERSELIDQVIKSVQEVSTYTFFTPEH